MSTATNNRAAYAHTNYFGGHVDETGGSDGTIEFNGASEPDGIDGRGRRAQETGMAPPGTGPDDGADSLQADAAFEADTAFEPPSDDELDAVEALLVSPDLGAKQLGAAGERYAALWLARMGWRPLASNWRTRFGELDIIMLTGERMVVFVEVKTRRTQRYGVPQAAITAHKQANLHHAASLWLAGPGRSVPRTGIRFDAVSILVRGGKPHVEHIPGAF
ncbi:YraN family protein [Bifidobacterium sp. ESL0763]|uniref:YraN family protein n=1 Tax=Bifidobacterium sp. ESL0763 TaxID=2983227 RepID=UPI0023F86F23|nr:YraN family protein [Bifidobacterium sp. ESL0763]MDF7664033.1 YraN family protein [Bifidobacterium sp. ESL0763]